MQRIDRRSQSMQRNITARDPVAASTDAREVAELYGFMADYFTQRGDAAEAVKLARDGAVLAGTVVDSLRESDFAGASRYARSIATACRDCHIRYKPLEP